MVSICPDSLSFPGQGGGGGTSVDLAVSFTGDPRTARNCVCCDCWLLLSSRMARGAGFGGIGGALWSVESYRVDCRFVCPLILGSLPSLVEIILACWLLASAGGRESAAQAAVAEADFVSMTSHTIARIVFPATGACVGEESAADCNVEKGAQISDSASAMVTEKNVHPKKGGRQSRLKLLTDTDGWRTPQWRSTRLEYYSSRHGRALLNYGTQLRLVVPAEGMSQWKWS